MQIFLCFQQINMEFPMGWIENFGKKGKQAGLVSEFSKKHLLFPRGVL